MRPTPKELKEYLVSWFEGHGAWHDDGTMVIYDEKHLHEFCEDLATKIDKEYFKVAFNKGWDVGYDFATNPDKADLRKRVEKLEREGGE